MQAWKEDKTNFKGLKSKEAKERAKIQRLRMQNVKKLK